MIHAHHDDNNIVLFVSDYHCEYALPTYTHGKRAKNDMSEWYRTELVWDHSAIEDLFGEDNMHKMIKMLPKELTEQYDEWSNVWSIHGSYRGIRMMLLEYAEEVLMGPKGADDDIYDYWPSAWYNVWQIAEDLDKIKPEGNVMLGIVQPMYDMMRENIGDLSEFEEDPWGRTDMPKGPDLGTMGWDKEQKVLKKKIRKFVKGVSK